MPHEKDDDALLWDMLDAALAVKKFVASHSFHGYQKDRMLRNAVERNIEIIGEAAGKCQKRSAMHTLRFPGSESLLSGT